MGRKKEKKGTDKVDKGADVCQHITSDPTQSERILDTHLVPELIFPNSPLGVLGPSGDCAARTVFDSFRLSKQS